MRSVYFSARLYLGANSSLALSLPQSSPQKLKGLTAPSSEGAEAAAAAKSQICHCSAQGSRDSRSVHSGVFNFALVLFTYLLYNNILARRGEAKKNPRRAENPPHAAPLRAVHYVFGSKK